MQVIEASRSAEHVLGAGATFVHPGTGNAYGLMCLKIHSTNQDLVVCRRRPPYDMDIPPEIIKVYDGAGADSDYQVTMGSCVILPTGALWVMFSAIPKGDTPVPPDTGFTAIEDVIPGVDEPYPLMSDVLSRLTALEQAALTGVSQHEANSVEIGGADAGYAYLDISAGETDYGYRLIRMNGHNRIESAGTLTILVDGKEVARFG